MPRTTPGRVAYEVPRVVPGLATFQANGLSLIIYFQTPCPFCQLDKTRDEITYAFLGPNRANP